MVAGAAVVLTARDTAGPAAVVEVAVRAVPVFSAERWGRADRGGGPRAVVGAGAPDEDDVAGRQRGQVAPVVPSTDVADDVVTVVEPSRPARVTVLPSTAVTRPTVVVESSRPSPPARPSPARPPPSVSPWPAGTCWAVSDVGVVPPSSTRPAANPTTTSAPAPRAATATTP
ncbi:MAG: hypothetical protein ACKVZ6_21050, partial [Kineosporiaceae bacterium]